MAVSASTRLAQVPKMCTLCEENTKTKWWCVQCKSYMCNKCKQIHTKVQVSIQHEIVDIKSARSLQDAQQKIVTYNIPCQEHKANMSCIYCKNCDEPVCPECISTTHQKHDFVSVEEFVSEQVDRLKDYEFHLSEDLVFCEETMKQIEKTEIECHSILDDTITKIKQKEQSLKDAINDYSLDLQNEVEEERIIIKKLFSEFRMNKEKTEQNIAHTQNKVQIALSSGQGNSICTAARELEVPERIVKFQVPNTIKQFSPGHGTSYGILDLFGSIKNLSLPQTGINIEVVKFYETNLKTISQLIVLDEKKAWISNSTENILLVSLRDDDISIITEIKTAIYDMALKPNNDILVSVQGQSEIKLLAQSGEIKPHFSVSPLFPLGIHVTSDNDVILGVIGGQRWSIKGKSTRAVVIYGEDGKQKHWYQYDAKKQRIFINPYRITTNVNNDILVIDSTSSSIGRVVALGIDEGILWTYEGNPQVNTISPFYPCGIVTTSISHIIVSDWANHNLHVLSRLGDILVCKSLNDIGIIYPVSLNIDRKGRFWIGCDTGGKCSGAEIHLLKFLQ